MRLLKELPLDLKNEVSEPIVFRERRLEDLLGFIDECASSILAIGKDKTEVKLANELHLSIVETSGDYNYSDWLPQIEHEYETVFCFEVIEHLLNPLLFLNRLKEFMTGDAVLYLSYPAWRPRFLWTNGHFHEYDSKRFKKLLEMANLEIIKEGRTRILWKKNYWGVRPLLRLIFPLRCKLFKIIIKGSNEILLFEER